MASASTQGPPPPPPRPVASGPSTSRQRSNARRAARAEWDRATDDDDHKNLLAAVINGANGFVRAADDQGGAVCVLPDERGALAAAAAEYGLNPDKLAAAGLTDRVFVTNTVFWRPPGNRTPTPAEQKVCLPFVERAIELISPKILLLVGGASAKAMLQREEGILSLRGRWFEWKDEAGRREIPALPTLHPAFLLRQPAAKKRAWSDLLTLVERLDRPERPV